MPRREEFRFVSRGRDRIYQKTGSLQRARRNVIIFGMLGAFVFLIPVVFTRDLKTVATCLSLACFFSELVVVPTFALSGTRR
jgi:VIT1/CCC1 family predicted Fe2+/Mn2+ transporter